MSGRGAVFRGSRLGMNAPCRDEVRLSREIRGLNHIFAKGFLGILISDRRKRMKRQIWIPLALGIVARIFFWIVAPPGMPRIMTSWMTPPTELICGEANSALQVRGGISWARSEKPWAVLRAMTIWPDVELSIRWQAQCRIRLAKWPTLPAIPSATSTATKQIQRTFQPLR